MAGFDGAAWGTLVTKIRNFLRRGREDYMLKCGWL